MVNYISSTEKRCTTCLETAYNKMKRIFSIAVLLAWCYAQVGAVSYCAASSWGYAGSNVTGGGNATPTVVKTESKKFDDTHFTFYPKSYPGVTINDMR